jgi:hypothetical protein
MIRGVRIIRKLIHLDMQRVGEMLRKTKGLLVLIKIVNIKDLLMLLYIKPMKSSKKFLNKFLNYSQIRMYILVEIKLSLIASPIKLNFYNWKELSKRYVTSLSSKTKKNAKIIELIERIPILDNR